MNQIEVLQLSSFVPTIHSFFQVYLIHFSQNFDSSNVVFSISTLEIVRFGVCFLQNNSHRLIGPVKKDYNQS